MAQGTRSRIKLEDNTPSWIGYLEDSQSRQNKVLRDKFTRCLYKEYNEKIFGNQLEPDMRIIWDGRMRSRVGTTRKALGRSDNRSCFIKLSPKAIYGVNNLRVVLLHELCHAAAWQIDAEVDAGHGPLWMKWVKKALSVYPELGEIPLNWFNNIHYKYTYKCTECGRCWKRHTASIDIEKQACNCNGSFEMFRNKKGKDGVVVATRVRKRKPNEFAKFVRENYAINKEGKTHAQVMKVLGRLYSARRRVTGSSD